MKATKVMTTMMAMVFGVTVSAYSEPMDIVLPSSHKISYGTSSMQTSPQSSEQFSRYGHVSGGELDKHTKLKQDEVRISKLLKKTLQDMKVTQDFVKNSTQRITGINEAITSYKKAVEKFLEERADCALLEEKYELQGVSSTKLAKKRVRECYEMLPSFSYREMYDRANALYLEMQKLNDEVGIETEYGQHLKLVSKRLEAQLDTLRQMNRLGGVK